MKNKTHSEETLVVGIGWLFSAGYGSSYGLTSTVDESAAAPDLFAIVF